LRLRSGLEDEGCWQAGSLEAGQVEGKPEEERYMGSKQKKGSSVAQEERGIKS